MDILQGAQIVQVGVRYENIIVQDDKGCIHYISKNQLAVILNEFDFFSVKKRTRNWLEVNIDDWKVEHVDEPRT